MFRTDFNHWLQSFESDVLTYFLTFISFLGNTYPLIIICIVFIAAINFRKGLIILNILSWTAILTVCLKTMIDYPRPLAVDPSLNGYGVEKTATDLTPLQPSGNFELFSAELLKEIRSTDIGRFGLPSGHTSIQIALWIGMAVLFNRRWLWFLSISMVLLTAWSRMYLGLHYAGDILGGIFTGCFVLVLIYALARKNHLLNADLSISIKNLSFFLLPLFYLPVSYIGGEWQAATLLGANVSVWWVSRGKPLPSLDESIKKRIISALALILVFLGSFLSARVLSSYLPKTGEILLMAIAGYFAFWLYLRIALTFRWIVYGRN